jgi:hypothetical protein
MAEHVDFQIVAANLGFLEGDFSVAGRTIRCAIHWDGQEGTLDRAIQQAARRAVQEALRPPRPSLELLQSKIGVHGHLDVELPTHL